MHLPHSLMIQFVLDVLQVFQVAFPNIRLCRSSQCNNAQFTLCFFSLSP
jgi:hypothetical protein